MGENRTKILALFIVILAVWISIIIATSSQNTIPELRHEAKAAYDWLVCRYNGGVPHQSPQAGNYYNMECTKS